MTENDFIEKYYQKFDKALHKYSMRHILRNKFREHIKEHVIKALVKDKTEADVKACEHMHYNGKLKCGKMPDFRKEITNARYL